MLSHTSLRAFILQDSGRFSAEAGTTIQTYVAGKKDGETQMIKLPEQSGVENLKAAQVYDVGPPGLALMGYMHWNGSLKQGCTFRLFFC